MIDGLKCLLMDLMITHFLKPSFQNIVLLTSSTNCLFYLSYSNGQYSLFFIRIYLMLMRAIDDVGHLQTTFALNTANE
jgi:hypothetical protein